jgi:hypothetical protein
MPPRWLAFFDIVQELPVTDERLECAALLQHSPIDDIRRSLEQHLHSDRFYIDALYLGISRTAVRDRIASATVKAAREQRAERRTF